MDIDKLIEDKLGEREKVIYNHFVDYAMDKPLYRDLDKLMISVVAIRWIEYFDKRDEVRSKGDVVTNPANKTPYESPHSKVMGKMLKDIRVFMRDCAFTPTERRKVMDYLKNDDTEDPVMKVFKEVA